MTTPSKSTAKKTPAGDEPEFRVVENNLHVITTTEGELVLPLKVKTKLFREISTEGSTELDQFFLLLDGIGDAGTVDKIDELDIFETNKIVARFFQEFEAKAQATLGESQRSSNS
jgi:hypothetical protein